MQRLGTNSTVMYFFFRRHIKYGFNYNTGRITLALLKPEIPNHVIVTLALENKLDILFYRFLLEWVWIPVTLEYL